MRFLILSVLAASVCAHNGVDHSKDKPAALNATAVQSALNTLCSNATNSRGVMIGVPYDMGCAFYAECGPTVDLAASSAGGDKHSTNASAVCENNLLLATICSPDQEGPGPQNAACQPFTQACANSTSSSLCDTDMMIDLPAFNLTTFEAWDNVQRICAYHAQHLGRIFNGTVSMPDPAAGRRRLLHAGHADDGDDDADSDMPAAGLNNTGVPHNEAAHEYCNSCLKESMDTATIAKTCPGGPMTSLSGLCSLSPTGTGNAQFDKQCDPWRAFCSEYGDYFHGFCHEWLVANQ